MLDEALEHHICCTCCGAIYTIHTKENEDALLVCKACDSKVYKHKENSLESIFFLSLTGLILFFPAIYLPLLKVSLGNTENGASVIESVTALYTTHPFVSVISFSFAVLFPLTYFLLVIIISSLSIKKRAEGLRKKALLVLSFIENWYMLDVFLISVFVGLIKLTGDFTVSFDYGFYLLILMGGLIILRDYYLSTEDLWKRIENEVN